MGGTVLVVLPSMKNLTVKVARSMTTLRAPPRKPSTASISTVNEKKEMKRPTWMNAFKISVVTRMANLTASLTTGRLSTIAPKFLNPKSTTAQWFETWSEVEKSQCHYDVWCKITHQLDRSCDLGAMLIVSFAHLSGETMLFSTTLFSSPLSWKVNFIVLKLCSDPFSNHSTASASWHGGIVIVPFSPSAFVPSIRGKS